MNHKLITLRLAIAGIFVAIALVGMLYVDRAAADSKYDQQNLLFFDDFSGDLSKWSDPIGDWSIDQEQLYCHGDPYTGGWIYAGDTAWTNYEFQAKVFFYTNAQIVFRSTGNHQNEYVLDLYQSPYGPGMGNTYALLKYQDGIMTNLSDGYIHTPVPLTDPIVVKVQISGNYLILYINDDYVIEIYDPDPLPNGRIGFGGDSDFRAWFDDVSVTMLPPIMFLPTHQEKYASPGDEITYTINLENHTGITDSFDLEVLPDYQWTTTLSTNTVGPIADGERISFNAQVDLTPGALPGDFDTAVIQATSVTSPTVYTQTATITTTAISRNTGYVSLPIENRLEVIDTEIHKAIGFLDMDAYGCGNVSQVRLTPDKSHLYINCGSSKIIIIETAHNSLVTSIDLPSEANDIVFTPDGAYAVVSSPAGQVFVIDTDSYEIIKTIATVSVVSIASHPYLPRIYLGGNDIHNACKIQVIDTNSFSVITTIPFQWELYDLQPSPDGRWLYVTAMNYNPAQPSIYKLDVRTLTTIQRLWDLGYLSTIQITPDNSKLFVALDDIGTVDVLDPINMTYLTSIDFDGVIDGMELTIDGSELYVANRVYFGGLVGVIDTRDYTISHQIPLSGQIPTSIAITPQLSDVYTGMTVNPNIVSAGRFVGYGITIKNFGSSEISNVVITDTLPISLTYKEGSLRATGGIYNYLDGVITWTGSISASNSVDITFRALVSPSIMVGTSITNTAIIRAPTQTYTRSVAINIVQEQVFLPCALRACLPTDLDDFSNPASGWSSESGDVYGMGYQNGEYYIAVNEGWIAWSLRDFGVSDFKIEVDTWPRVNLDGGAGIMFSTTDNGFYLFEISDGWYSLWRVDGVNWNWTPLIDWTYSPTVHPGIQVNRLGVVRVGSNIKIYANGQILGSVDDGTYRGTWSGMASEAYNGYFDSRFDNFALYTGTCIGAQSVVLAKDQAASSDATYIESGAAHTSPKLMPVK
jgi:uncharacterized repeat protein (TIGR01451 family)